MKAFSEGIAMRVKQGADSLLLILPNARPVDTLGTKTVAKDHQDNENDAYAPAHQGNQPPGHAC